MISGELAQAAHIIRKGGVVAYATEYCFGLGCDPMNRAAVLRLLRIKRRPSQKGLILIATNVDQLAPYVDDIPSMVAATWPGPYTWLLVPSDGVPGWLTGDHPRIALRITAHEQAAALCKTVSMAIVSTSANRSGSEPCRSFRDTVRRFRGEVDYILPGLVGGAPAPTPIRDVASGELIRTG